MLLDPNDPKGKYEWRSLCKIGGGLKMTELKKLTDANISELGLKWQDYSSSSALSFPVPLKCGTKEYPDKVILS